MAITIRRFAETHASPWLNGHGEMWALVDDDLVPGLAPGRSWRLSLARLTGPAPFSSFPDQQRTLVPWGGSLRLEIDGRVQDVPHGHPVRFSGAATTRLVWLDRPCHAVNLMASGGEPTLAPAPAGARFTQPAIALVTEATTAVGRFDVIALDPREPLPTEGVVMRVAAD